MKSNQVLNQIRYDFKTYYFYFSLQLQHEKQYEDEIEEQKRFDIFTENCRKIDEHNAKYEQGLVR